MHFERESVDAILPGHTVVEGEFKLWEEDPDHKDRIKLSLSVMGREIVSSHDDFFSAMRVIRRELEKDGILLNCYGASKNVFPPPISQEMGQGWKAHKLRIAHPASQQDLVSIFDSGPDVFPSTVDEQEQFYEQWLESLRSPQAATEEDRTIL